ncbi:MAG: hypothetical protein ACX932_00820 [Gammaproteobacteria bacterium]
MFVTFIKFIHLVCALSSVGLVAFGWQITQISHQPRHEKDKTTTNPIIILGGAILLAAITGCLLVYPKGYTFHTAWIRAALLLVGVALIILINIYYLHHKKIFSLLQKVFYSFLLIVLVMIIHDAVQKTTELPLMWLGLGS